MAPRKRKRRSAFKVNSGSNQGSSENGNESPIRALEIPLIFQRIMRFMPVPHILNNCSLVNKFWCHEARTFLRDKRTCTLSTALIKSQGDAIVVENLMKSSVIPFNKISVYCSGQEEFWQGVKPAMVRLEQQILQLIEKMKLKSLYIYEDEKELFRNRRMSRSIIEQAVRKKNGTIEEISMCFMPFMSALLLGQDYRPDDFGAFLKGLLASENLSLPALRTLAFHREQRVWTGLLENCVLPIIAAAPRLQNIFLTVPFTKPTLQLVSPVLSAEHVHLFKRFRFDANFYNPDEWNGLLANVEVECKHLEIFLVSRPSNREPPQHQLQIILGLLQPFLARNQNSISVIVSDVPTILILHQHGLLGLFRRLKHLRLKEEPLRADQREQLFPVVSSFSQSLPELMSLATENKVQGPVFDRKFPIIMDPISTEETPVQQNDDIARRGLKELIIRECYDQTVVETWAAMLPEIQHLVVSSAPEINDIMDVSHIWRHWPSLVSLEVVYHSMNPVDFNSTVCGLADAELMMLEKKTMKQLTQSMIVPTGPSITGMAKLKQLAINVISEKAYLKKMKCPVPKIAQALAFGRMENLRFQFQYVSKHRLRRGNDIIPSEL